MSLDEPLLKTLPTPQTVRNRLGDVLREAELLRRLLKLSERAEQYREWDRYQGDEQASSGREERERNG